MKLFGNSSAKHVSKHAPEPEAPERPPRSPIREPEPPKPARRPAPMPEERPAPPEPTPEVRFVRVEPAPEEAVEVLGFTDTEAETPEKPEAPEKPAKQRKERRSRFWLGYAIYVGVFLVLIAGAMILGWNWLGNYEASRPHITMENYLRKADPAYWRDFLLTKGVEESFVDGLDLSDASYYKKMDRYTDASPAYGIRFGDRTMLVTTLKPGRELSFGQTAWDVDTVELVPSRVTVYAPAGAELRVRGEPVSRDCLKQENALALTLGELEQTRTDIPGLDKYEIGYIYGNENLRVTDGEGNELPLSERRGSAYYYAPLTADYRITAPAGASVTVNGVTLSAENAAVETVYNEDFEDLSAYVSPQPGVSTYTVEGLLARPEVTATLENAPVVLEREDDHGFVFAQAEDPDFTAEVRPRILNAFDAYIAFSGNRGAELNANYARYRGYLVPDSVAADRAAKALDSLYWVKGRDTALQQSELKEVLRYGENCFTALIDYSLNVDGSIGENSTLFIFVRYNDAWRIVNILNKSTVV